MSKTSLLNDWYHDIWVEGDLGSLERYFTSDAVEAGLLPGIELSSDDFLDLVQAVRTLIEPEKVAVTRSFENGDWLAALVRFQAKGRDSGVTVDFSGQVMVRFDGDKMVESHNHFDFVSLFQQLDQMPSDTVPICLTGQRLGLV